MMCWQRLFHRPTRPCPRPAIAGREQSALDALRRAEGRAAVTDAVARRAERLADEIARALGAHR